MHDQVSFYEGTLIIRLTRSALLRLNHWKCTSY